MVGRAALVKGRPRVGIYPLQHGSPCKERITLHYTHRLSLRQNLAGEKRGWWLEWALQAGMAGHWRPKLAVRLPGLQVVNQRPVSVHLPQLASAQRT